MIRRLFALWVLLVAAAFSAAQLPGNVPLPVVDYNPLLLINASVQKELKMSPQSAANVQNTFMQEAMRLVPALTGSKGDGSATFTDVERGTMMSKGIVRMQTRLVALLTSSQRVRLRQLTLQSIGPSAVLQPKVATALALTSAQRSTLEEALSDVNAKITKGLTDRQAPQNVKTRLAGMNELQTRAKAAGEKVLARVLTAPQKAKWKALQGKPFPLSGFLGAGSIVPSISGK